MGGRAGLHTALWLRRSINCLLIPVLAANTLTELFSFRFFPNLIGLVYNSRLWAERDMLSHWQLKGHLFHAYMYVGHSGTPVSLHTVTSRVYLRLQLDHSLLGGTGSAQ